MFGDNIRIPKDSFDKLIDTVTGAVVNELDKCKKEIDADKDGYISIKEMKLYVKSIIKILKAFIRGL